MKLSQVNTLNVFDEKSDQKSLNEFKSTYHSTKKRNLDSLASDMIKLKSTAKSFDKPWTSSMTVELEHKIEKDTIEKTSSNSQSSHEFQTSKMKESEANQSTDSQKPEPNSVKVELHISKTSNETFELVETKNDHSGMETLAEIAANSLKLDASKSNEVPVSIKCHDTNRSTQNEPVSRKEISAKNIASEYLKIANEQDNATIEDSGASSDSDAMYENNSKQMRRSSLVSMGPHGQEVLISARTVVVGEDGFKSKSLNSKDLPVVALQRGTSSNNASRSNVAFIQEDGKPSRCTMCSASFPKSHQLVLHMNIHYMNPERKFRCDSCGINFYTQGRLQKHMRSETHNSKVNMVESLGQSTSKNPRPFECSDCNRAFRIHGHLAKHLRSKTHVQKLECLQKLPFGTYTMIEEAKINLTHVDTTDCDNSLASLKAFPVKLKVESTGLAHKRSLSSENSESHSSESNSKEGAQESTSDMGSNENVGCLVKKRKLSDRCDENLTINESDEN